MAGYPRAAGSGCVWGSPGLQSCPCRANRFSWLQPRQWAMASKRVLRTPSLHWCIFNDYKLKQTLCGVWSMCGLQLGDSHPSQSAKPRGSLIMQRTAEFKALSHLWGMFGRGRSHMPEGFRPAQKRKVWACLGGGRFGIRNVSTRHRETPFPLSRSQGTTLGVPHWGGHTVLVPPAGSPAGETKQRRWLTSVLQHWEGEAEAARDGTRQGCQTQRFKHTVATGNFSLSWDHVSSPVPPTCIITETMDGISCLLLSGWQIHFREGMKGGCEKAWLL